MSVADHLASLDQTQLAQEIEEAFASAFDRLYQKTGVMVCNIDVQWVAVPGGVTVDLSTATVEYMIAERRLNG